MIEVTLEEIQKKFESLPEDLRWAIMAANVDEKITQIGKDNNLTVEQMGQLSLETHMVMFGFTHPDKFEASVKASLQLPDEKNKTIVNKINETILKDIREKLMSLYGKQEEKNNDEILNKAGIEINKEEPISTSDGLATGAGKADNRDEMIKKVEDPELIAKEIQNKKIMQSISAQKLSGSFQIPNTKTEYSLNNMSKSAKTPEGPKDTGVKVPLGATIKPTSGATASTSPSFSVKVDPYREMPE
jgi:hypothetical protein